MKTSLLKTVLVAGACFLCGNVALADTEVIYERGGEGTAWSDADLSVWTGNTSATIDNALVQSGTNGSFEETLAVNVESTSIVTMTASLTGGGASGRNGSYDYITIGGVSLRLYGQDKIASVVVDGAESNLSGYTRDGIYNITVTIDQAANTASYSITGGATGSAENVVCTTKVTDVKVGHYKAGRENYGVTVKLNSIEITEETQSVAEGTYTVKYVCNGVEIKEATTGTGVVGNYAVVSEDPIWFEGEKYIYVSDDAQQNPISAAGAVITVEYRKAEMCAYTFKSSVGDWEVSGTAYEGEDVTVDYPRLLVDGTTAYIVKGIDWSKNNIQYAKTATITENNQEVVIDYITFAQNVLYFAEGEDICEKAYTGAPTRTSLGKAGLLEGTLDVTTLAPGTYKLYAASHCANSSAGATITYKVGEETVLTQEPKGWLALEYEGKEVKVAATGVLSITKEGDNAAGLDYILVTMSEAAGQTNADGWASFSCPLPLDLTNADVKAYVAVSEDGEAVNLESISGVIPANTGIMIKGEANADFAINVTEEAGASVGTNMLKAIAAGEEINGAAGEIYLYGKHDGVSAFYKLATTLTAPANVCYLEVNGTSPAPRLRIIVDGTDVSGIADIEAAADNSFDCFNINGQRVINPTKGLYIINGKKVLR